jgi:large subunit ribosomal protein L19
MSLVDKIAKKQFRTDIPEFRTGDTVRVSVSIREGDNKRVQAFEGTVIARKNTGAGETFTVRKISFGQGVERIFPVHSKVIEKIDVVRHGKTRRSKLYYLRDLKGKAARLRERAQPGHAASHDRAKASEKAS